MSICADIQENVFFRYPWGTGAIVAVDVITMGADVDTGITVANKEIRTWVTSPTVFIFSTITKAFNVFTVLSIINTVDTVT